MTTVKKMFPAVCGCGRSGRSQNPSYYMCGYCYYSNGAKSAGEQAARLRVRAQKLEGEAVDFWARAANFARRHPLPESK